MEQGKLNKINFETQLNSFADITSYTLYNRYNNSGEFENLANKYSMLKLYLK
jgi:hypothetical protein